MTDVSVDRDMGVAPTTVYQPMSDDEQEDRDTPGDHCIIKAKQVLDDAPNLNIESILRPGMMLNEQRINNIPVPSAGSRNLSSAHVMLEQSLDSGNSLLGRKRTEGKQADAGSGGLPENYATNPVTQTSINNSFGIKHRSLIHTSEDNMTSLTSVSQPASSYVKLGTSMDDSGRLAEVNSLQNVIQEDQGNNLDQASTSNPSDCCRPVLPNNINNSTQSLSFNEASPGPEIHLIAQKAAGKLKTAGKSTQTDPSDDEDGGNGACSTIAESKSSIPSDDTLVNNLKLPVITWLERKLETPIGASWRDLADRHNWDYERITDFGNHCSTKKASPFCSMLVEEEFQSYRLSDLKTDLLHLPRIDILNGLNPYMEKCYNI